MCNKIKEHIESLEIYESDFGEDPDKRDYIVSNDKIEKAGWAPQFSIDDGIVELLKMYNYISVNPYVNK